MVKVTKGLNAALAATLCGAVMLTAAPSASAATQRSAAASTSSAAAKKAEDAANAARTAAEAAAKVSAKAQAAKTKAAAVATAKAAASKAAAQKAAEKAEKAEATKKAKAEKAEAAAAAKAAKAAAYAAKKLAAAAKALAAKEAAEALKLTKLADLAARTAQHLRDVQAAKDAKDALAIPTAPVDLSALRVPTALNDFVVSWSAPTGKVKRYDVTVYADGTKTVTSTTKTSLSVTGRSLQSVYRIEVAARDADGNGATSKIVLAPALAGAPSGLTTSATSATSGVALSWLPPTRLGYSPVEGYRVQLTDRTAGVESSQETTETAAVFANADPTHKFEATVTAVTREGDGLPMTVTIGDLTSTVPRGFTALRDAHNPTEVNLSWSPPVWQAYDAITDYEIGIGSETDITWMPVGLTESVTVPLELSATAVYYVRAVNAAGPSPSDDAFVNVVSKTQLPSSGAPVVLSADDQQVDVALYGTLGDETLDRLVITTTSTANGYRSEQTVVNGSDGVAFRDLANGTYVVSVIGHDSETGSEAALFDGSIALSGTAAKSVEATFDAGVGYWHGVYPGRHLPRVVSTQDISFDGTGSMAITAMWDSIRTNITAGTSGRGGIAVRPKQPVTVSALGRPGAPSNWNMGISWWDAKGNQISLVRAKRVTGVVNAWRPSRSTYTAPAGAVSATAFVEIGGLRKGETFYVDGITLQSK